MRRETMSKPMKKPMKKPMLALGLASVMLLSLAGVAPVSAAKKKLSVWLGTSYEWKTATAMFEKTHPNIDVVLLDGDIDKFYTMTMAGMMPDVWGPWSTPGLTADVNRNWALDIGPYVKRDGKAMNIDDFFPGLMGQCRIRGKLYSLPIFSYTDWFFYNTTMWAQAGIQPPPLDASDKSWNWESMLATALKTTKRSADGTKISQAGLEFSRSFIDTPNFVRMWGARIYSEEAYRSTIPQDIDMNSPQMKTALTKVWELIYKHRVTTPAGMPFLNNKTASSIEEGWRAFYYMNVKAMKWAIAPLPWAVSNAGTIYPDGLIISRISKNKDAAWEYVKYLCSPEVMRMIVTDPKSNRRGSAVARKSVFSETMGSEVGKVTGMNPVDVYRVHKQADEVGIAKEKETICLHTDLARQYIEPVLTQFWANKISPSQIADTLDSTAAKGMAILFTRWMRNVKYTGVQI